MAHSRFDIGDVFGAPEYSSFALSPDGRWLAAARVEHVPGAGRYSRIVVIPAEPGAGEPDVVFTGDSDGWAPEFADDGRSLLFLTDLAGEARPWVALGPEAVPAPVAGVTRMAAVAKWRPSATPGATRGFALLSFATRAEQGASDPLIWDAIPEAGFRHLYRVDSLEGPLRKLTAGPEDVYDFAWSPDGERLALLVAPGFEMERRLASELRIVRADDGEVVLRRPMPRGLNAFVSWSPAGTHLAYVAHGVDGRAGKPDLYTMRIDGGDVRCVSRAVPGWVSRYDWAPGGAALWLLSAEGVRSAVYRAPLDGGEYAEPRAVLRPDAFVSGLSVAKRSGRIALRLEGPRTPAFLACAEPLRDNDSALGPLRLLTPRSRAREARIPGDAEVLEARAPDGERVEAVLLRPRAGEPAPRPLCVWLHGGPNEFCALSYQSWWQLFVARGFAVLAPNFRGSGSGSEASVRRNVGDLGGGDADDVIACLDALGRRGGHPHVDLERVVLFGWSYGAHLAFHVARKLGRRRRAPSAKHVRRIVAGGGVYDWLSHYGQAELRFPWRDYLGASPLLDAAEADARSPVRRARELGRLLRKCEVVLAHGLGDGRANPVQSRTMYRALREAGVEATLVLYPREVHVLAEPDHIRDLLDRATKPLPVKST